jgi:hypothetical protein
VISSLLGGLGGKLAERWAAALFTPAFGFWALGALAWWIDLSDAGRRHYLQVYGGLSGTTQAVLVVVSLLVVAASSAAAERFTLPVLRALEGYWPLPFRWLARVLVKRRADRLQTMERRWVDLYARHTDETSTRDEAVELVDLERRLGTMPAHADRLMPTRLGNILRAAESGIDDKYGIDPIRCWPALWLVLPEGTRAELTAARARLDTAAVWLLWVALVVLWSVFTPWAVLVAVVGVVAAYQNLLSAAAPYGALVDASYALHRGLLYDALGRPRPAQPTEERAAGQTLTAALWRGPEVAAQLSATARPPT